MPVLELRQGLPRYEGSHIVEHQAANRRTGPRGQHHADQSPHRGADPVDEWRPAFTRQLLDEAADRPRLDRPRRERDQGRRIGEIEREAVVLFVYQPLAGPAPDHINRNDAAILGELRGEHVEVAAVARQPMHADDGMVLAGVATFVVGDAMESMWSRARKVFSRGSGGIRNWP